MKILKTRKNLESSLQLQCYSNIMWKTISHCIHTQQFFLRCLDRVERVCRVCILLYIKVNSLWLMCLEKIQSHQVEYLALL